MFIRVVFGHKSVSVLKNKMEQVRALVQEFPDLLEPRRDGSLPLHGVCDDFCKEDGRRPDRLKKIQRLMEIDSSCLLVQDCGRVPLVCLLASYSNYEVQEANSDPESLDLIKKMIQAEPLAVMMRGGHATLSNSRFFSSTTALHQACGSDDLLPIVDIILSMDPESLYESESGGGLPLHMACCCQQFKIVKRLICVHEANGIPCTMTMTRSGNTPLHCALWDPAVDPELVHLLVNAYPSFVSTKNIQNETPLHVACDRRASIQVIEILVRADRNMLSIEDKNGNIPIHSMFAFYPLNDLMSIMRHLTPLLSELIKIRKRNGKLPGHEKCRVKFLADVTPLLETEHALHAYLNWINELSGARYLWGENPVAAVVLDWITTQEADCNEQLDSLTLEINDLVSAHTYTRTNETTLPIELD